jgi:hypothetical protein
MFRPEWRRIRGRDTYALGFGVLLTLYMFGPSDYLPPALAPCPNSAWQDDVSFFVVLSCGVALVEVLNWLFARNPAGDDLLMPRGWTGVTLGLLLLVAPYVIHNPDRCELWHLGKISLGFVLSTVALAYGLVLVGQVIQDINTKVSRQKPRSP